MHHTPTAATFRGNVRPAVEDGLFGSGCLRPLRRARALPTERIALHVQHDLIPIPSGPAIEVSGQGTLSQQGEGVGTSLRLRSLLSGGLLGWPVRHLSKQSIGRGIERPLHDRA
jgi:hypothetical protein